MESQLVEKRATDGASVWAVENVLDYFPRLKERRNIKAGNLSGHEQQMIEIRCSLLCNPPVALIDEPPEGLAPKKMAVMDEAIKNIHRCAVSIELVVQKLLIAMKVSSHFCVKVGMESLFVKGHQKPLNRTSNC